jgi:hypothetical protein
MGRGFGEKSLTVGVTETATSGNATGDSGDTIGDSGDTTGDSGDTTSDSKGKKAAVGCGDAGVFVTGADFLL